MTPIDTTCRAVAIGGGTGLPKVLRALRTLGYDTTAIVTTADDGGSSGELRRQLGILPPGDARNCLVALADDPDGAPARLFQYRFASGDGLAGHALGNLVIAALADIEGGFAEALGAAGRLLSIDGRVLPSTLADVVMHACDRAGSEVVGQAVIARNPVSIHSVRLEPDAPPAYPPALSAIAAADLVTIGPGSLFTSIMPNLLVDGIAEALRASRALRVYVCNVANQRGETMGMDADNHVDALHRHGLHGAIDVIIVHDSRVTLVPLDACPVDASAAVRARIEARGLRVVAADVADSLDPRHHDSAKVAAVFEQLMAEVG